MGSIPDMAAGDHEEDEDQDEDLGGPRAKRLWWIISASLSLTGMGVVAWIRWGGGSEPTPSVSSGTARIAALVVLVQLLHIGVLLVATGLAGIIRWRDRTSGQRRAYAVYAAFTCCLGAVALWLMTMVLAEQVR